MRAIYDTWLVTGRLPYGHHAKCTRIWHMTSSSRRKIPSIQTMIFGIVNANLRVGLDS